MMKRQWSGAGVQFVLAVLLGGVALSEQMVVTGIHTQNHACIRAHGYVYVYTNAFMHTHTNTYCS